MRFVWHNVSLVFGIVFVCMIVMTGVSIAQTLSTDAPAPQKLYEVLLKLLFPALWTVGGPWLTGLVTRNFARVPKSFQVVISSVLSAVVGGVAGFIPDFPLSVESAAEMAGAGGATGQVLANMRPETLHPKKNDV